MIGARRLTAGQACEYRELKPSPDGRGLVEVWKPAVFSHMTRGNKPVVLIGDIAKDLPGPEDVR